VRGRNNARRWCGAAGEEGEEVIDPDRVQLNRSRCNPYLRVQPDAGGGAKGVDRGLRARARGHEQIFERPEEAAEGIDSLPRSLSGGRRREEDSEIVAEALGENVFEH